MDRAATADLMLREWRATRSSAGGTGRTTARRADGAPLSGLRYAA